MISGLHELSGSYSRRKERGNVSGGLKRADNADKNAGCNSDEEGKN